MSRNVTLAIGAICWALVAIIAIGHLLVGDLLVPAAMFVVFIGGLALSLIHHAERAAASSADA